MAEPALVVGGTAATGLVAATAIPGIDINAVICAMAGALFFVTYAPDLPAWKRAFYFVVSWIGGYYAAQEIVAREWTAYSGLPALLSSALVVTLLISVIEWVVTGKMPGWIKAAIGWAQQVFAKSGGTNG
ncbi:putative phage holin [compost metagenome]